MGDIMSDSKKRIISDIKEQLWDLHRTCERLSNYYSSCYTQDGFDDDSIWSLQDLRLCRRNLKTSTRNIERFIEKFIDTEEWEDYSS